MLVDIQIPNRNNGIKHQKSDGDNAVINAINHKGMARGPHVGQPFAVHNKGGDVPAHDEYALRSTEQEHTHEVDFPEVFRHQKQRRSTKMSSKIASNNKHYNEPETQ